MAQVETPEDQSLAWLDGWSAHQYRPDSTFCPYNQITQARSRVEWHKGWMERDSRKKAGTLQMQPNYDLAPDWADN